MSLKVKLKFQANGRRSSRGTVQPGGAPSGKTSEVSLDGHAVILFACHDGYAFKSSIVPCPVYLDPAFGNELSIFSLVK